MPADGQNAALKEEALAKARGQDLGAMDRADHPACGVNRILDADTGQIELLMPDGETPRKKIALIGFASSTKEMAPTEDPEWAIVGMNQLYRHLPRRVDLHIEIHRVWNTAVVPGTDHAAWLRDCGVPVLMAERVPDLPTTVRYPIERLIEKFSLDYFTSTVAYMVAYAVDYIDQAVERRLRDSSGNGLASAWDVAQLQRSIYAEYSIGIFGIDLIVGDEYDWQKACAEFWIGQALARNITVIIPPQSALLKQRYRYGYDMEPQDLILDSDIAKRERYLTGEHQKHSEAVVQLVGAMNELAYWKELRTLREHGGSVGK